jgi:hypothetical protein
VNDAPRWRTEDYRKQVPKMKRTSIEVLNRGCRSRERSSFVLMCGPSTDDRHSPASFILPICALGTGNNGFSRVAKAAADRSCVRADSFTVQ